MIESGTTVTVSLDLVNKSQAINITDIVDSVKFIKLETTDESLIGEIRHVIFYDGLYYINEKKSASVLVFDETGKYKFKISKKGRGPGEYGEISRLLIDKKNRRILIYDVHARKMIYYTLEGQFVKEIHNFSDAAVARDLILLSDGGFLCYTHDYMDGQKYWGVWKVDSSGKFDKFVWKPTIHYPHQFIEDNPYFYELPDDKVGLWCADINDIFHFSNDTVIYRLSMNVNKTTLADFPGQERENIPSEHTIKLFVMEKDNFILTQWWDKSKNYPDIHSLYLKKENKWLVSTGCFNFTDIVSGDIVRINCTDQMLLVIDMSYAEFIISDETTFSKENKDLVKSMFNGDDDNPVLQILYLKK
jgi:hypothetical protein